MPKFSGLLVGLVRADEEGILGPTYSVRLSLHIRSKEVTRTDVRSML